MSRRLLIVGSGGHGRVVHDVARASGHEIVGFIDSDEQLVGKVVGGTGTTVVMSQADFLEQVRSGVIDEAVAIAIGDNRTRLDVLRSVEALALPVIVHPTATVSPSASLGPGTVVMPAAVINSNAKVGRGVIVNSAAVVEHDCVVANGAHISPGAVLAGGVVVHEGAWIGAASCVIGGVEVGEYAIVGAGAVVIRSVPPHTTVVGCPAAPVRRK